MLDDDTNLYYFNARYYDATTGRFLNVDPIQDGTNWYVYCHNNPLALVDPTGLDDSNINFQLKDIAVVKTYKEPWKDVYGKLHPSDDYTIT